MPQITWEEPDGVPGWRWAKIAPKDPHAFWPPNEGRGQDIVAEATQDPNHVLPEAQPVKELPPREQRAKPFVPRDANGEWRFPIVNVHVEGTGPTIRPTGVKHERVGRGKARPLDDAPEAMWEAIQEQANASHTEGRSAGAGHGLGAKVAGRE